MSAPSSTSVLPFLPSSPPLPKTHAATQVHEGPHGIGTRVAYNDVKLKAGFTVSNEPGFYSDGAFGIRIENVVVVRKVESRNDFGGVGWLGFERVTMVCFPSLFFLSLLGFCGEGERAGIEEGKRVMLDDAAQS